MWLRHLTSSLLLIVVSGTPSVRAQGPATRDSAGIHIIENAKPLWTGAQVQHLAAAPSLVIGMQAGPNYEFSKIAGAARLSDGRIVVADGASLQLRFFDATGTFRKSSGRKGEGPGEFTQLDMFSMLAGDTVAAGWFSGNLSLFSGTGDFLRVLNPNSPSLPLPPGRSINLAVLNGNARVIGKLDLSARHPAVSSWIDSFPAGLFNNRNGVVRVYGNLASHMVVLDQGMPRAPWFAPTIAFAASTTSFFVGFGNAYAIQVFSVNGPIQYIIHRRWTPVKVTAGDWDTYVTEWSKRWVKTNGAQAEKEKADLRDAPYARTLPAFSQFLADRTGRLWVREPHIADAPGAGQLNTMPLVPSVWSVFDAQGRWLEDVTMPARFSPMDIGADYVLGVARDADGVESVVKYPLGH